MKTLVTGAGGFVGLNVLEALLRRDDEVVALDADDFPSYAFTVFKRLPGALAAIRADVRDRGALH